MKYTMIKGCKMDWDTEHHRFIFVTGGDSLAALDSLKDIIGSLKDLQDHILNNHGVFGKGVEEIPYEFEVYGGCAIRTYIEGKAG